MPCERLPRAVRWALGSNVVLWRGPSLRDVVAVTRKRPQDESDGVAAGEAAVWAKTHQGPLEVEYGPVRSLTAWPPDPLPSDYPALIGGRIGHVAPNSPPPARSRVF
jgi:hypothetical protein